jgi:hypothetical protein
VEASAPNPTLPNAGMTELEDAAITAQPVATNGFTPTVSEPEKASAAPSQTSIGDAVNTLAEAAWDRQAPSVTANTDGWVEELRDSSETEIGVQATPTSVQQAKSWAEDVPAAAPTAPNGEVNDGFERVIHHQRQNSSRGRGRGRGRGDGFHGRRGEFRGRGRGRGDFRGGRGRGGFGGPQGNHGDGPNRPSAPSAGQ